MNRLIQDLLDVAALEAGVLSIEWAPIEPDKLIADVVAAQGPLPAASSIELRSGPRRRAVRSRLARRSTRLSSTFE